MTEKNYAKGTHPNSLANLTYHKGRKPDYGSRKNRRGINMTDEAWEKIKVLATAYGCSSVSDFLEKVARGLVELKEPA